MTRGLRRCRSVRAKRWVGGSGARAGGCGGCSPPPDTGRDPGALSRLLESLWDFTRTHVRETDGAIAFAVFAVSLLGDRVARGSVLTGLFTFLLAFPLAWRRRAPVTVLAVTAVAALAQWLAGPPLLADVALLAALYTVAAD